MIFNNYPQSSKAILGVRIWRITKDENGKWILKPAHIGVEATRWEKISRARCFDEVKQHTFLGFLIVNVAGFHAYYSLERALA